MDINVIKNILFHIDKCVMILNHIVILIYFVVCLFMQFLLINSVYLLFKEIISNTRMITMFSFMIVIRYFIFICLLFILI